VHILARELGIYYNANSESLTSKLHFFIKLRNKIEHRHIEKRGVDTLISDDMPVTFV
jgi:hypothetical protein